MFTARKLPDDINYPAILINQPTSGTWGTKGDKGGEIGIDVMVYDDKDQSDLAIHDIAVAIWELLDRSSPDASADGYSIVGPWATPPVQIVDPDGYPGYRVSLRMLVLRD